jgi:hypothetical protein
MGVFAEMIFGNFSGTGWLQKIRTRILSDHDPQPPAVPNFALDFDKDHPAGLVHMPMVRRPTLLKDACIERMNQFLNPFQTAREGSWRNAESFQCQRLANPEEGSLEKKLLQQKMNPETDGEQALGNQLRRRRRRQNSGNHLTMAIGNVTGPFMNSAKQANVPMDFFGILRAGKNAERLLTKGTMPFIFRKGVGNFLGRKLKASFAAMSLRPRLLTSRALIFWRRRVGVGGLVAAVNFIRRDCRSLRFPPEKLLLQSVG